MKICFIMNPWNQIDPEVDSTLRLIHEAVLRKHTVAISTMHNLTIRDNVTSSFCDVILKNVKITDNIPGFHRRVTFRRSQLPLSGFDAILMRVNPPLDTLALNFLDSVHADTFVMNEILGLRLANNKLYTASFQDSGSSEFIPGTHVSKNREYLERIFTESISTRMILKPLVGYGGHGVIVIEKSARQSFRSLLDFYIGPNNPNGGNYVILQDYVQGAEQGDVRILMLNGKPIGAMCRVPSKDDVRSNVHAGGTVLKHRLTTQEKKLCEYIGPKLLRDGLFFVGIDVINGKLIEVNVMSPGGITRINKLNRTRLQQKVLDFVEGVVNSRELKLSRKYEYRQVVENADMV